MNKLYVKMSLPFRLYELWFAAFCGRWQIH